MEKELTIHFHQRIIVRLIVPISTLVAVLFIVLASFVWYTYRADQNAANEIPKTVSESMRGKVTNFFDTQRLNISLTAKNIREIPLTLDQQRFLGEVVDGNPALLEMIVLNDSRNEVYRAIKPTAGVVADISNPIIKKSTERVFATRKEDITKPLQTSSKTSYIVWSVPIFSQTNQIIGVLSTTIDISVFWQIAVDVAPLNIDTHIYITDPEGHILISNKKLDSEALVSRVGDILFRINSNQQTAEYSGVLGNVVAGKAALLTPTDWYAIAEVSYSDLTKNSRRNIGILFFAIVFILMLVFYTFYSLHYNLVKPLATFRSAITELSNGNFATRIKIDARNELSLLADIINKMAMSIETQTTEIIARLKHTIADLDRSAKTLMKRDEELSRANDRLLSLDHAKSEFVSIAAHQLRTPLSALKWAQQMLIDGEAGQISESQKNLLLQSQESVRRMVTLVNDLLVADHLEYGKVAYNFQNVCPEEVLSKMVLELKPMADEHKIKIDCNFESKSLINADPERIKEAFLNVINNAIKYSPDGGTVTIRANYGMGKVVFSITDTGIGIPEIDRNRLFEKFVRMENAKKVDANGSGLGLFIVKKVIDAHGGKIWFTSMEGQGSTFFIEFPVVNN